MLGAAPVASQDQSCRLRLLMFVDAGEVPVLEGSTHPAHTIRVAETAIAAWYPRDGSRRAAPGTTTLLGANVAVGKALSATLPTRAAD